MSPDSAPPPEPNADLSPDRDPHHPPTDDASVIGGALRSLSGTRRTLLLLVAFLAPCAVIALSVASMMRDSQRQSPSTSNVVAVSPSAALVPTVDNGAATAANSAADPNPVGDDGAATEFFDETDDGEPTRREAKPRRYGTVQQAAAESCSTSSVAGLSQQIIEQMRCLRPRAFVPLPQRPNLVVGSSVIPYLGRETRDRLVRALEARPGKRMTVNSALRTVAQQYLVSRWAAGQRCGVQLANRPGDSNHELGSALDIAEPTEWRAALEAEGFRWLGQSDRVHFDYRGATGAGETAQDVLAFQVLWNRNHQEDRIEANGRYSSATEQRLKQAPAQGFPLGPQCKAGQ